MCQERQNRSKSDTKTIDSISAVKLCNHVILILSNAMLKTEACPQLTYSRTAIDKHVGLYFVWEEEAITLCCVSRVAMHASIHIYLFFIYCHSISISIVNVTIPHVIHMPRESESIQVGY